MLNKSRLRFIATALFGLVGLAGIASLYVGLTTTIPTYAVVAGVDQPFFMQNERVTAKAAIIKSGTPVDVLFIGDSITQNYDEPDYQPVWNKYFAPLHAFNLGYGMDSAGSTHWRIGQGELLGLNPRVTVVLLGTNDTNYTQSVDQTFARLALVVADIKIHLPKTKILLIGILPSDRSPHKTSADKEINAKNAAFYAGDPRVMFIDISPVFMKDGVLNADLYVEKKPKLALHPNPEGQELMAAAIEPVVKRLLAETP